MCQHGLRLVASWSLGSYPRLPSEPRHVVTTKEQLLGVGEPLYVCGVLSFTASPQVHKSVPSCHHPPQLNLSFV